MCVRERNRIRTTLFIPCGNDPIELPTVPVSFFSYRPYPVNDGTRVSNAMEELSRWVTNVDVAGSNWLRIRLLMIDLGGGYLGNSLLGQ